MDNKDFNLISNTPGLEFMNINAKAVVSSRTNSGYELDVNGTRWPIQKEQRTGYYNLEIKNDAGTLIGYLTLRDTKPDSTKYPYTLEVTTPDGVKYLTTPYKVWNKIRFTSRKRGTSGYYRECHGTHRVDIYDYSGAIICQLKPWYQSNENKTGINTVVFPSQCADFEVPLPVELTEVLKMGFYRKIEAKSSLRHEMWCDIYNHELGWQRILYVDNYRTYNSKWATTVYNINFQKQ